jgi:hypothetical protein
VCVQRQNTNTQSKDIKKRDTKKEEDKLIRLQVKIDKLDALLGNQNDATTRLVG